MGRGLGLASLTICSAAVLCIGGVHPHVQVALSAAGLLVTALFLFHTSRTGTPLVAFAKPALLATSATLFQLVPLPGALVQFLSPRTFALRAEVGPTVLLPLTLDVPATFIELTKGLACLGLLLTVGNVARKREIARSLLLGIVVLGALLAFLTIAQRLIGVQKIFGLYSLKETPGSGFFGSFVNGNHAASALTTFALITAGWAAERSRAARFASALLVGILSALVFFTGSRGGALGLFLGAGLLTFGLSTRHVGLRRGAIVTLFLSGLAIGAAFFAVGNLGSRWSSFGALVHNQKTRGWRDALHLAGDFPLTGVGRGAFEAPIEAYRAHGEGVRLVYPENVALQVACEWGVPLALTLFGMCLLTFARLYRAIPQLEPSVLGAACALVAVGSHELFDFGLETSGVALLTVLTLGVVVARSEALLRIRQTRRPRLPRVASVALVFVWIGALAGGAWASHHTLEFDFERLSAAIKPEAARKSWKLREEFDLARARHPADHHLELLAAAQALMNRDHAAIHHLNRALRLCPGSWQAHRLAAQSLAVAHRPAQAAVEYRLALESGMPPMYDEIVRATGSSALDAVPSRMEDLLQLAAALTRVRRADLADAACTRAIEVSMRAAVALRTRLQLAMQSGDRTLVEQAATQLFGSEVSVEDAIGAAEALDHFGLPAAADRAILTGMKSHSKDEGLFVLKRAELRFAHGDLTGAEAILNQERAHLHSLLEQRRAEELSAQIAERQGRVDEAILARSRARQLSRQQEAIDASELRP
jgi:hypothetical protein